MQGMREELEALAFKWGYPDAHEAVVDKLTAALDKALDDEGTRKRLLELGSDIPGKDRRGQPALAALVKSEIDKWTPILKGAGTN